MSLAMILYPPPTPEGMREWSMHHWQHHLALADGIRLTRGIETTLFRIYPMSLMNDDWALQHQMQHTEMTTILDVQSQDLKVVDFQDEKQRDSWMYQHFVEHQVCAQRLGIPI